MPEALGSQVLGMSHKTHRAGCPRARPPLGSSSQQRWGREPRCQIPKEDAIFRIPLAPGARALCTFPHMVISCGRQPQKAPLCSVFWRKLKLREVERLA